MATPSKDPRRATLAMIHIAQAQLGLDDDTYRAILERTVGVRSAATLTPVQAEDVLCAFERLGWKRRPARYGLHHRSTRVESTAMLARINALLTRRNLPWRYADSMAKRMFGIDLVS